MDEFSIDSSFGTFDIGYYRLERCILFPNPFYEIFCFHFSIKLMQTDNLIVIFFQSNTQNSLNKNVNQIESNRIEMNQNKSSKRHEW